MDSQQPPPPLPHATTTAHGRAHENLKSLVMKCAIASAPTKSLSHQRKTFIKRRIQELFPTTIHTPHHPPYAWMIENAIKQLNEEGGWDEEAISKFILAEYKDLPWPHAALLKHHLQRLSETAHLTQTHHGCYFIGRPTLTKPNLRITCTTSRSRSRSPSPSPTPVSSSSPTYDTSSSSQSFDLKKKKKRYCRKKSQRQKQNARGMGIHPKYKEGRGRAHARGRGRGRDGSSGNPCNEEMKKEVCCGQLGGDMCADGMRVVEILSLLTKDEATDEDIQRKQVPQEEANKDCVDLESQEQPIMVIGFEALQCEYGINEARIEPLQQNMGTIPSSHGRKLASEDKESKRIRPQRRNSHSRNNNKTQSGMRRGRSRKRENGNNMNLVEVKLMEGETQYANGVEQEEGDSMDALIDEVYIQLTEPTELLRLTIDGEAAEGNLETNMKQEIVNVGIETGDVTEMQNKMIPQTHVIYDDECKISDDLNEQESKFGKVVEKQRHLKEEQGVCIEEQNQCGEVRPTRPRRNKSSTNVADADRSKSSSTAARPALQRRRK